MLAAVETVWTPAEFTLMAAEWRTIVEALVLAAVDTVWTPAELTLMAAE